MTPQIFIGGTGRSGTSILYQAVGCHKVIYAFPREMRFLIDPDGLMNLVDALTTRYSPYQADNALFRFERLMRVYLTTPDRAPYRGFDFDSMLGGKYYWQQLDEFCSQLVELEFKGIAYYTEPVNEGRLVMWAKKLQTMRQRFQGEPVVPFGLTLPRNGTMRIVKYFPDRSNLINLAATFVNNCFLQAAQENGKQTWCEKTPQNLFHLDFLWELFPESIFIHVKRDPRGVVHSLIQQRWAPNNVKIAAQFLRKMYDRWFDVRSMLDLKRYRYLELKLEDLAASPKRMLAEVASFCGLENHFESLPNITIDKVNYWQKEMSSQDIRLVNEIVGPYYFEQMGYEF